MSLTSLLVTAVGENLTKCQVVEKLSSTLSKWLKIEPDLQFCSKKSLQIMQIDTDIFDGVMKSSVFGDDVISDDFQKIHFRRTDFCKTFIIYLAKVLIILKHT